MSADTRLRELLQDMAPPPKVPEAHVATARASLHAAYRDEAPVRSIVRRRPSLAWVGAAVAAVVVTVALLLPGSSPSVDASLEQIARAARALDAADMPAGSFVYSRLESTVQSGIPIEEGSPEALYLVSRTVDRWVRGGLEETVTTVNAVTFFDPEVEAVYYAAGRDIDDRIGKAVTSRLDIPDTRDITKWSDDPTILGEQLAAELATSIDSSLAEEVQLLQLIEELLDPRFNAPPALRAALIEVVGSSDVTTRKLANGSVLVSLRYEHLDLGGFIHELEFDAAGYMRTTRLIAVDPGPTMKVPPGTVVDQATWSLPYVVDGPGEFPHAP